MQLQGAIQPYPLRFQPLLRERVWGGVALARYGKPVPAGATIGECWEISDRNDAPSIVANGPLAGQTLRQVIARWGRQLLGARCPVPDRFPLLVKLLDARERLSLQVHPPAGVAGSLGGEPKTEMWYVLEAAPDSFLIAGLKRGVTRRQFEDAIRAGGVAFQACIHQLPVHTGDALFVPSGRLHAIGDGLLLAEIQQSSDTTYRVYDWDRVGADGRPRELHVAESLASINFTDFEPSLDRLPITCEHFHVEHLTVAGTLDGHCDGSTFQILVGATGTVRVGEEQLTPGATLLLPAALGHYALTGSGTLLCATLPPRG